MSPSPTKPTSGVVQSGAPPAGRGEAVDAGGRRRRRVMPVAVVGLGGCSRRCRSSLPRFDAGLARCFAAMYATSALIWVAGMVDPKCGGITPGLVARGDVRVRVDDRRLDVGERDPARRFRALRSGCRGRARPSRRRRDRLERVAGATAVLREDHRRRAVPPPPPGCGAVCVEPRYQVVNAACVITIASLRISEWPSPQSSVQITG